MVPAGTYHGVYAEKEFVHVRPIDHLGEGDLFMVTGASSEHPSFFYIDANEQRRFIFTPVISCTRPMMGWMVMSMEEYQVFNPSKLKED